jgi:hypothetical protein
MTMKVGAYVFTGRCGGMTGEIVGIHSESVLTGNSYIIRILYKNSEDDIFGSHMPDEGELWEKYPYDYVVLHERMIVHASESTLSTLRSLNIIPDKVTCLETYSVLQKEKKLRLAVKELKIDETHLREFLEKTAKEYIKALHIKGGEVHAVYPLDFIVRIKATYGYGGFKHIRVPIADFFEGKSSVTQMGLDMQKAIKELCIPVVEKVSETPNVSRPVVTREMFEQDMTQKVRETPDKTSTGVTLTQTYPKTKKKAPTKVVKSIKRNKK